ncbi:hypothetical protein Tco_0322749 [Tanacetum coccineum]
MTKPLSPHQPSLENNPPNQALPNPYIKNTTTSPQGVSHPPFFISPINSHDTHTQASSQSDNQTPHINDTPISQQALSRLEAKGFISPSNLKVADRISPISSDSDSDRDSNESGDSDGD